jgi:hypothetical protein
MIEKVLEKLGAKPCNLFKGMYRLTRVCELIQPHTLPPAHQWLLIGEITEALRERGFSSFSNVFSPVEEEDDSANTLRISWHDEPMLSKRCKWFHADTLLECYMKAVLEGE